MTFKDSTLSRGTFPLVIQSQQRHTVHSRHQHVTVILFEGLVQRVYQSDYVSPKDDVCCVSNNKSLINVKLTTE